MPAPLRLSGQTASAGYARGPLWLAPSRTETHYRGSGDVNRESSALANALEKASAATAELIASAEGDAADILEFQLAMIEDDTFRVSANGRIAGGEDAATAWTAVLDAEIAGYEASDDAYFAARAADLADIRDRVLSMLTGEKAGVIPAGVIYVGDDITPSVFLAHDWTGGGFALRHGSATGHVAMLARQRGVPALVAIGDAPLEAGVDSLLDASTGSLTASPAPQDIAEFEAGRQSSVERAAFAAQYAARPARTADGAPIDVLVNIAEPSDTASIPIAHCDGVGLMRTEFLYAHGLPDEDTQYAAYRTVLEWAEGKPVTIRTVDAGGDKPVPGFTVDESNPFLGLRGIRLCLAKPDIFAVQIRALLRAAVRGNLKVMLPMVSVPEELEQARTLFRAEADKLERAGIPCAMPPLGIMVEVPSVAIRPDLFAAAAFFSIGSNDLTQYVMAASRDSAKLSALARPDHPAVLELVRRVAQWGDENGRPVSLCGDAASDPALAPLLLKSGLRSLSIAASRIGAVKAAIANAEVAAP